MTGDRTRFAYAVSRLRDWLCATVITQDISVGRSVVHAINILLVPPGDTLMRAGGDPLRQTPGFEWVVLGMRLSQCQAGTGHDAGAAPVNPTSVVSFPALAAALAAASTIRWCTEC